MEGNKPQATPCCCGKYTFPTFEVETLDWSWSPITDDDGVHEWDRCLSGLRDDAMDDVVRPSDVVEKCRCQDRPSGSDAPIRHDTSPLAEFLDIDQDGEGMCRVSIDPVHLSPNGTMHGGALFTMFDTAMGTAAAGHLAEGQMCVTMEIQIRYLKPIFEGEVEVHGTVLHPGRRIIQTEARAPSGGRLLASATGSFVVLDSDEERKGARTARSAKERGLTGGSHGIQSQRLPEVLRLAGHRLPFPTSSQSPVVTCWLSRVDTFQTCFNWIGMSRSHCGQWSRWLLTI